MSDSICASLRKKRGTMAAVARCNLYNQIEPLARSDATQWFSANAHFVDAKNLDYRLMPSSPCIGKASDGGDIGCRYTPKMIEMCKTALELRKKGIIKF